MNWTSIEEVEYQARCHVNGTIKNPHTGKLEPHSAHWSAKFIRHPWVMDAEREGWARELRSAVIYAVKHRIMRGLPFDRIEDLMPDSKWVEQQRSNAQRFADGAECRARLIEENGSLDRALAKINRQPKEHAGPGRSLHETLHDMGFSPEQIAHLKPQGSSGETFVKLPDVSRPAFERRHTEKLKRMKPVPQPRAYKEDA